MVDTRQHQTGKHLSVGDHSSYGNATKTDTMVAALAANDAVARPVTVEPVITDGDLQRGVDCVGAASREEHIVQTFRRQSGNALSKLERRRMRHIERRHIVQLADLTADGLDNLRMAVPHPRAPQSREAIEYLFAVRTEQVATARLDKEPRTLLEELVWSKPHEVRLQVEVRLCCFCNGHVGSHPRG